MTVTFFDREMLTDIAAHHWQRGWFPVPGAVGKKPALNDYACWTALARRGDRPDWPEVEQTFHGERVVGIGHLILAGWCGVDVDGPAGEAVLSAGDVPEGPEVATVHGRHVYFTGAESLPSFARLGPKIHLLGPGHYVELPPTSGKEWVRHVGGAIPRLPRHLREILRDQKASRSSNTPHGLRADTEAELAAWRELLGELHGSGPWRGPCPLHPDDRYSFSVFPGQDDGRLIGRCFAGCGFWTLRRLRQRLGHRLVAQYTRAHEAITALGDAIDAPTRDALRWIVRQAETYGLDLADSTEGVAATYRQLAAATGLEQVGDDGKLSNRGRTILRLYDRLRALGIVVIVGKQWTADGGKGAPTRILLPAAWHQETHREV